MKKIVFFVFWLIILSFSFVTIAKAPAVPLLLGVPKIVNLLQRESGLLVFSLLFVQIVLGFFLSGFVKKFGNWIIKFHFWEGIFAYILAFLHPFLMLVSSQLEGGKFDPYVAFINACLICRTPSDYYLTTGRIAFWVLTFGVFAVVFKESIPWLKKNWKRLHMLNYVAFLAVAIHGFFIGMDFRDQPFFAFAILSTLTVLGIFILFELPRLYKDFKDWIND